MSYYRCYFLNRQEAIEGAQSVDAETDTEATEKATALLDEKGGRAHGIEVWEGRRLVHRHVNTVGSG